MYVRPKFGPFAGELQDMRPDAARELIAQGRATDPRNEERKEDRHEEKPLKFEQQPAAQPHKPKRRVR